MADVITLDMDTPSVQYLCRKDKRLAKVISMVGPITYEPHEDGYAFLVHEIIEQMLSIKAGAKIYGRLENLCGGKISVAKISILTEENLRAIGTSGKKAACIKALTYAVINEKLPLSGLDDMSDQDIIRILMSIKGIGTWTAKMYLIFVLDRPDVLPYEDVAFQQGYKWTYKTDDVSRRSIEKKCKKWKPFSSIAARYMYCALDKGLTNEEFHLFK